MSDVAAAQAEIERWLVRAEQAPESKAFAPLADAYRAAGRQQDAVRVLEAGLQRHPDYVSGLVLLGLCWREMHEDERAESVFARVLELDPDNLVALRHRAECARRRGVPERAAEYLRRALAIDPFDRDVQADLGLVTTTLERQARERREAAPPPVGVARPSAPRVVAAPPGAAARIPYPAVLPAADAPAAADPFEVPAAPAQPVPVARAAAPPVPREPAPAPTPPPLQAAAPGPPPLQSAMPAPERVPAAEPAPAPPTPTIAPSSISAPAAPPSSDLRGRPAVEPPSIDLRRVGRGEPLPAALPEPAPTASPVEPPPAVPSDAKADAPPSWRYTREADRIVVAPSDTPVRGPIRSVEDRLFGEQRPLAGASQPPVAPAPAAPAAESASAAPGAPSGEFATITLARIYESQGYLQKAAGIYETLQRQRPDDPEIAQRLMALRRRQSGAAEPAPAIAPPPALAAAVPPAPAVPPSRPAAAVTPSPSVPVPPRPEEERGVAWRLLDPGQLGDPTETARRLRSVTEAARGQEQRRHHTVVGVPPAPAPAPPLPAPPPAAPPEDLSRGHEDYQRFLSYLRSLRP